MPELTQYGDKELWFVTGAMAEGDWSLPIYVFHYKCEEKEFIRVAPIQVVPAQSAKLKSIFVDHSIWSQNGQYMVDREWFESIAHKAPGVTPDCYRHWPGVESKVPAAYQLQVATSEDDEPENDGGRFIDFITQRAGISRKLLRMAWWAMAEYGPEWLVAHQKPIDLGYAVIYPVPFRCDWKQKMEPFAGKFDLNQPEFIAELCKGDKLAIDNHSRYLQWTFELVPSKSLEQRVDQVEVTQFRLGADRYVKRLENIIAKLLPSILPIYQKYLEKIALPVARICYRGYGSKRHLVPLPPHAKPVNLFKNRRLTPDISKPSAASENQVERLRPKITELPPVPDLPTPTDDMRECQETNHVDKPQDQPI